MLLLTFTTFAFVTFFYAPSCAVAHHDVPSSALGVSARSIDASSEPHRGTTTGLVRRAEGGPLHRRKWEDLMGSGAGSSPPPGERGSWHHLGRTGSTDNAKSGSSRGSAHERTPFLLNTAGASHPHGASKLGGHGVHEAGPSSSSSSSSPPLEVQGRHRCAQATYYGKLVHLYQTLHGQKGPGNAVVGGRQAGRTAAELYAAHNGLMEEFRLMEHKWMSPAELEERTDPGARARAQREWRSACAVHCAACIGLTGLASPLLIIAGYALTIGLHP